MVDVKPSNSLMRLIVAALTVVGQVGEPNELECVGTGVNANMKAMIGVFICFYYCSFLCVAEGVCWRGGKKMLG